MSPAGADDRLHADGLHALLVALAEGDAATPPAQLSDRVVAAATAARAAGAPVDAPAWISGLDVLRRAVARFDDLLDELSPDEWRRPAVRYQDVAGVVAHLIGVEQAFDAVLAGRPDPSVGTGHAEMTEHAISRWHGRPPSAVHDEWSDRATASLSAASELRPDAPVDFYAATFPVDELLVIRAFELWIHEEDVRRATARPLADPDPESLARMTATALVLLPSGLGAVGRQRPGRSARLVLTGAGGGTWDVPLGGPGHATAGAPADVRVVVGAADFCRVVADRCDPASTGAIVTGDPALADDVFAGAAALALD